MSEHSIALFVFLSLATRSYAQGTLDFSNFAPDAPVTISTTPGMFNPTNGPAGAYLGSDYTASLFFLNGVFTDQDEFDDSNPSLFSGADTQFLGMTGTAPEHGPNVDLAGFFGQGVYLSAASSLIVTVQVRAWYNGNGLYTSYDEALAAGQNVGKSNPVSLTLATGLDSPAPMFGLLPFTVGIIPEPSSLALLALGSLPLILSRRNRRKSSVAEDR